MITLIILSVVILYGFIICGISKFGMLKSYSAYSAKWGELYPNHNMELWSVVTVLTAFLIFPVMLNAGDGDPAQCLGFFAPLYLVAVGLTPHYESNKSQEMAHKYLAMLCAVVSITWMVFVTGTWPAVLLCALIAFVAMMVTKTTGSLILWSELVMFVSVHWTLLVLFCHN